MKMELLGLLIMAGWLAVLGYYWYLSRQQLKLGDRVEQLQHKFERENED